MDRMTTNNLILYAKEFEAKIESTYHHVTMGAFLLRFFGELRFVILRNMRKGGIIDGGNDLGRNIKEMQERYRRNRAVMCGRRGREYGRHGVYVCILQPDR